MKVMFEGDVSVYMEREGLHVFFYLHPDMQEPLEFIVPYEEMIDSVVESHIYPRTGELSEEGFEVLTELVEIFSSQAVSIGDLIHKFRGKDYVYRKDT